MPSVRLCCRGLSPARPLRQGRHVQELRALFLTSAALSSPRGISPIPLASVTGRLEHQHSNSPLSPEVIQLTAYWRKLLIQTVLKVPQICAIFPINLVVCQCFSCSSFSSYLANLPLFALHVLAQKGFPRGGCSVKSAPTSSTLHLQPWVHSHCLLFTYGLSLLLDLSRPCKDKARSVSSLFTVPSMWWMPNKNVSYWGNEGCHTTMQMSFI